MLNRIRYRLRAIVRRSAMERAVCAGSNRSAPTCGSPSDSSRKPLSSATIVLVLAIGIAGYAAVFGLLQSAIMRPPPGVPSDVPLVLLRGMVRQKEQPSWSPMRFSYPAVREMSGLRTIGSG
jgi:hypothetical protein